MPIRQKLTPPVLLFCVFAGWVVIITIFFIDISEPGRHYAASSRPQGGHGRGGGGGYQPQQAQKGINRSHSLSKSVKTSGQHPHLPKSGASKQAKRSSKTDGNEDWKRTPDAGQSG